MQEVNEILQNVKKVQPIVHCITNYVTANDCANVTIAVGGIPIMADEPREVEEITEHCQALMINLGTINERTVKAMLLAGKQANKQHISIVIDTVGVGTSVFRNKTIATLLRELNFAVIKGNISEMKFLGGQITSVNGVGANSDDTVTEENLADNVKFAMNLSAMAGSVVAITGNINIIANRREAYVIRNGSSITMKAAGPECMCSAVMASYVGATPQNALWAAATAVGVMSVAARQAQQSVEELSLGIGSYKTLIIDYVGKMDTEVLEANIVLEHMAVN